MSEQASDQQAQFMDVLEPYLTAFSGNISLAFYRFADNLYLEHQADTPRPAASLIKLPIMLEVLSQCDVGECQLDAPVTMSTEDQVTGSGVMQYLTHGLQLSIQDLVTLMIIVSDNTATNMLIEHVGIRAVNRRIQAIGLRDTQLVGKLQLSEDKQNRSQRKGAFNTTCASAMLAFLVKLQQGQLMSPEMTTLALSILKNQQYTEALARYLPTDAALYPDAVTVASKSGCLRGVWHDAGIISQQDGTPLYALVMMTEGSQDRSFGFEQEGMMTIAKVSRDIFERYALHLI